MSVRLVQRHISTVHTLERGQYTRETASGKPAIACPSCGGISDIENEVSDAGEVRLLWQCPYACLFAAFLRLESYAEEVLR